VSRQVSGVLDVEDCVKGPYALEVSSPGIDRPLFTRAQFERFVGAAVRVKLQRPLDGRRQLRGRLEAMDGEQAVINCEGITMRIPLAAIDRARLDSDADRRGSGAAAQRAARPKPPRTARV
jgi:ribosome maturation factor RimP